MTPAAFATLAAFVAFAAPHDGMPEAKRPARPARADLRAPSGETSAVPSTAFGPDGRIFAAWVEGDRVVVSSSPDLGTSWGRAVPVASSALGFDDNGEGRPKIAAGTKGELFVTFTEKGSSPYSGNVRFSRSTDGGKSFSLPVTVHDDRSPTGHRFDVPSAGPDGSVTVAWIDKRDRDAAKAAGRAYAGAALYAAVSTDGGATFGPNRKVLDEVCECCRIAAAPDPAGGTFLFLRAIFGGKTRDHALVRLSPDGSTASVRRVTFDGWEIDACPHHGPALAVSRDGTVHLAWYTGEGKSGRGLFTARTRDGGETVSPAVRLAPVESRAAHPALLVTAGSPGEVVAAWLESVAGRRHVVAKRSRDGGATWGDSAELASVAVGAADHPFLLEAPGAGGPFLSWFTEERGLAVTSAR